MMDQVVAIDELQIVYCDSGKKAIPLLFIHGNSSSKEAFHFQLEGPAFSNYRTLAIDLPGHGKSTWEKDLSNYSLLQFAKIIAKFIKKLHLKNVILIGHSLGGHAALEACSFIPDVAGLFIWNAPPISKLEDMGTAFLPTPYSPVNLTKDTTADEANQCALAMAPKASAKEIEKIANQILKTDPHFREAFIQTVVSGKFLNEIEILKSLKIPYRLVVGENDPLISAKYIQTLELDKKTEDFFILLKGLSHYAHVEDPAFFNQELHAFLSSFNI